jgi:hypothetical protein
MHTTYLSQHTVFLSVTCKLWIFKTREGMHVLQFSWQCL